MVVYHGSVILLFFGGYTLDERGAIVNRWGRQAALPQPQATGRSPIRQGKATLAIRGEGIGRPTVLCISAVAAQVCVRLLRSPTLTKIVTL